MAATAPSVEVDVVDFLEDGTEAIVVVAMKARQTSVIWCHLDQGALSSSQVVSHFCALAAEMLASDAKIYTQFKERQARVADVKIPE